MATRGVSMTIQYVAWDTSANAGKIGDAANHTLRWVKDGTAAAPTNTPVEVDATNAPGVYKLTLTATEADADIGTLCGKSSTANVSIMPITIQFERLPNAAPGATGGLPTVDASNRIAGIQGTKNTLDDLNDLTAAQVNAEVDTALNTAIPASPTADSINERIKTLDDNYTAARAPKLDNLDAAITTRSSHSAADVWSVASRTLTAFSFAVDLNFDQALPGAPTVDTVGNALVNANTYLDATISSRGDATAANQSTITTHLTDIKGATFNASTDSLEAIRDRGDAAWTTATGFSTHSAADVWSVATRSLTDKAGFSLATSEHNAIADATLSRNVSNVEASAPEHSLCTTVLAMLESSVSGTTWTIKRTDGVTSHASKTVTTDANADPITGVA